jgi:lysophospholipase L1-like esterase
MSSQKGNAMNSLACRAAVVLAAAGAAQGQIFRLGAMGDSLSDEYAEQSYGSYAKNWTMQFVLFRSVNMGPTATQANQAGGTWGEPRRTMYESNWARYGDTTDDLLTDGEHTGLAGQVSTLGVSHAVLMIGANDFNSVGFGAYYSIYNNQWTQTQIQSYVNSRLANIQTVLNTVTPTGVHLVIANVLDFGVTPITQSLYTNATNRDRVTAVIQQLNAGVLGLAQQYHLVLVDVFGMAQVAWGTNTNPRTTLLIGNVPIQLRAADTSSNGNPLAAFVDDRVHPNTTMQGVLANVIMEAMNEGYQAGMTQFSEQEILSHAGIAYGGSDTLLAVLGSYAAYVHNFAPVACYANCDGSTTSPVLNVSDFTCFLQKFAGGDPYANCDGSTSTPVLNVNDFTCFLQKFAGGCS